MSAFALWRIAETAPLGVLDDQQQSQIILLATHQDDTQPCLRCNHSIWFLVDL